MYRNVSASQEFEISKHTSRLNFQPFLIVSLVATFLIWNYWWTKLTCVKAMFEIRRVHRQKLPNHRNTTLFQLPQKEHMISKANCHLKSGDS